MIGLATDTGGDGDGDGVSADIDAGNFSALLSPVVCTDATGSVSIGDA
jgi:hypothetical protein